MELLSPKGTVFQGSTYAGNPISVTAGVATLEKLREVKNDLYPKLSRFSDTLTDGIKDHMKDLKIKPVLITSRQCSNFILQMSK